MVAATVETLLREQLQERRQKLESAETVVPGDERVRRLLREVDAALMRMDEESFGLCETCHETIEAERLVGDPLLRYCLDHLSAAQQHALEDDLDLAARVLQGLLPPPTLRFPGYEVARHYEGAGPISGDYCDVLDARDGSIYFVLGDVSGKGVAASMLMAHLHATFRALVPLNLPLDQLIGRASRLFCESALPSHFATLVCGRAFASGEVELTNAGHVPALIRRGGDIVRIEASGLPIGMFCDERFSVRRLRLSPEDSILLYTDGVSESRDPAGEEYGIDRLARLMSESRTLVPERLLAACLRDLTAFRAGAPKADDLALMAVRRID
ncbi:MAG: hypothetical protein AUI47_09335 [Acidobacteria bacterium 13_1_40CM_2_68_5]|nr:MAG: hypothetical protein AUI47_09335 [Acidobacteria bacterium 13_1_40CM_2_68_5]